MSSVGEPEMGFICPWLTSDDNWGKRASVGFWEFGRCEFWPGGEITNNCEEMSDVTFTTSKR